MDAFLPGGQLERPLSWLGRARLPAHLRVLTATTPAAVLSPPRATRIRSSRTACNRRAAPLPSIVGAGIEDPCAICPEICGVTRLEPYVATRRGGGRLAEGSSSHISWCVHCSVWFLYLHRCRSRGPAVQGATWQRRSVATSPFFSPNTLSTTTDPRRGFEPRAARAHARALAQHWARDWRALALTQVHHGSSVVQNKKKRDSHSDLGSAACQPSAEAGAGPCSREEPAPTSSTRSRGLAERPASWRRARCQRQTQLPRDGASGSSRCV